MSEFRGARRLVARLGGRALLVTQICGWAWWKCALLELPLVAPVVGLRLGDDAKKAETRRKAGIQMATYFKDILMDVAKNQALPFLQQQEGAVASEVKEEAKAALRAWLAKHPDAPDKIADRIVDMAEYEAEGGSF